MQSEAKLEKGVKQESARTVLWGYSRFIRAFGLLSLCFFWLLSIYLPDEYMRIFSDRTVFEYTFVPLILISFYVFFFLKIEDQKWYIQSVGMLWSLFFFMVVYLTGGPMSPFALLLLFPVLTVATELSPRKVLVQGAFSMLFFAATVLTNSEAFDDKAALLVYFFNLIFLGIFIIYFYELVKDTLRHKYEKDEANKRYYAMADADRVKGDFITVISHQLRTPLSGARYALHEAKTGKDLRARELLITQALNRIDATTRMVDEMLKTLETGDADMRKNWATFDLLDATKKVIVELELEKKKNDVTVEISAEESNFSVYGNEKLVSAAVSHVIENAIAYAPGGLVSVSVKKYGKDVEIVVRDTGIGISPGDSPHIFERFYRAKNAIELAPNELGVGLFTALQILERHGGSVALVVSEPGKGSEFKIVLPLKE